MGFVWSYYILFVFVFLLVVIFCLKPNDLRPCYFEFVFFDLHMLVKIGSLFLMTVVGSFVRLSIASERLISFVDDLCLTFVNWLSALDIFIDDRDVIDSFGCSVFILGFVEAFSSHDFINSSTLFFLFPLFCSGVFTVSDDSELWFEVMIWLRICGWGVVSTIVCHDILG